MKNIITSIDNVQLRTINHLREYLYKKSPGDEVILNVRRGKINKDVKIKLGRGGEKK